MGELKNFGTSVYFTAYCINSISDTQELDRKFSQVYRYIPFDHVYLETHRDGLDIERGKMEAFKRYFTDRGIRVSGAVTTTLLKKVRADASIDVTGGFTSGGTSSCTDEKAKTDQNRYIMQWAPICYTNEENREKLRSIIAYTASIFDELILDDFYFTNCTCDECIEAKGDRSWQEFRMEQMSEVSRDLIVNTAKAVNHDCNVIIKYPNWYEAYQVNGYNPKEESFIFDDIYTGVETRDARHSLQHLPRYLSYSIVRLLENTRPGHNRGSWMDWLNCIQNLDFYLEQAHFCLFAGARELNLFCFSGIYDSVFVPALGFELEKLDRMIGEFGKPVGIPVYEPFDANGEDHLYDYLGMAGIPFEPVPAFPDASGMVMLTENSAYDEDIMKKLKTHLKAGGDVFLTSGFVRKAEEKGYGIGELTTAHYTARKVSSAVYNIWNSRAIASDDQYLEGCEVTVPQIDYANNATDCTASLVYGCDNYPLLLKNGYSNGTVYVLTVPDVYGDILKYPSEVLTEIRRSIMSGMGMYMESRADISLFMYDNSIFTLEATGEHSCSALMHIRGRNIELTELGSDRHAEKLCEMNGETIFRIYLEPMMYRSFKIR
jgi:hypothetical protein